MSTERPEDSAQDAAEEQPPVGETATRSVGEEAPQDDDGGGADDRPIIIGGGS